MRKKIILWGFGSLFILLLAIVLILPTFIDSSSLKKKIQVAVSQKNIGKIDYENAYLSIIPLPHLSIEKIKFSAHERLRADVETLDVYPELLSLFRGQLRVSKVLLDTPELTAVLSDEPPEKNDSEKKISQKNLSQRLTDAVAPLAGYSSGLTISIEQGSIRLNEGDKQTIEITDLDLDADIDIPGPRLFNANLDAVSTALTIKQADKKVVIDCDRLKAKLSVDEDNLIFSLEDFRLAQPALKLSGHFTASPDTKGFSLDLNGKDLDVQAIRAAALSLGGDNETVTDTFSYLKGGRIPDIRIQSQSRKLAELGDLDKMIIQGILLDGDISVDDIGMQLTEVSGDALIAKGFLEASGASARLGETTGHDGTLKIGLPEDNFAFHLDLVLNARLDQVPSVLEEIVDPGVFLQELSLIKNIRGSSEGRLILGENLNELNTRLEISEMAFSADYQRLPFPVEIRRGTLLYQENMVSIENLDARAGNSMFSEVLCNVNWEKNIEIDIPAGRLRCDLGEVYPWLSSFAPLQESLSNVREISGVLDLSALRLILPEEINNTSEQWQFSSTGEVEKVTISTAQLPEPLHLLSGKIQITPDQLLFRNLNAQLMDAEFDLKGSILGNIRKPDSMNVSLYGSLGEKTVQFLIQTGHLPSAYRVHAPVQFANTDITWQSADAFSFKGNTFFPKGAHLFTDFQYKAGDLQINRLDIHDQQLKAELAMDLQNDRVNLKFNGDLHCKTLDQIFVTEKLSDGWIKGNFDVHFARDRLSDSSLEGQLEGKNLKVPIAGSSPLFIDEFALAAKDNSIAVNQFSISYLKNRLDLKGQVDLTPGSLFKLNLDASANDLNWDFVEKNPDETVTLTENQSSFDLWKYPVSGIIKLSAKSVSLNKYTWEPVHAQISREQDTLKIDVSEANLCGTDTLGSIKLDGRTLDLDFQLTAKDRDIATTLDCLDKNQIAMSGLYDLTGQINAGGETETLFHNVKGNFDFNARNGVITKDKKLSRILEVINFTEIVKGRIPDFKTEGFEYETITVNGTFADDMMVLNKLYMDGKTLDLLGTGTFDLDQEVLDVELLASPFKTVDTAIKSIPGINYLMAGNLVSIPVRVRGNTTDPKVSIMSAAEISSNFLDFAEKTIKSPIRMIKNFNFYKKAKPESGLPPSQE